RPTGTASTAAATDRPTKRSTGSSSAACAGTPAPAPTWNDAPKTACPRRRSSAASNATSPASSTSSSPHQTILNSPLDIHRSILLQGHDPAHTLDAVFVNAPLRDYADRP